MLLTFFDATNGVREKGILQKEYLRSIPLITPTASALVEGWNQALSGILVEVMPDFLHSAQKGIQRQKIK
jgi:hypothetical protein